MSEIDDVEEELMTPEGIAQYADALINVQRKEQIPVMAEIKKKQEYFSCDDDEKELFRQIVNGYIFTADDCLPEIVDCYMQLAVKKNESGIGYDMSCTFCREKNGKSYWFNISPADFFLIIQLMGNYKPNVIHSFEPYFFFQDDIVDIVDGVVKSQFQARTPRKRIRITK